jgi:hypothetical protein
MHQKKLHSNTNVSTVEIIDPLHKPENQIQMSRAESPLYPSNQTNSNKFLQNINTLTDNSILKNCNIDDVIIQPDFKLENFNFMNNSMLNINNFLNFQHPNLFNQNLFYEYNRYLQFQLGFMQFSNMLNNFNLNL